MLTLSLTTPGVPAADLRLPDFGDPSLQYLGSDEERQLGAQVQARLRQRGLIIEDAQLDEYLNSLGRRLSGYANQAGYEYTFYWIDADSINAFAAPGGFIGVHAGLMLNTASEDELAGVLAHETAHVSQRHIARAYAEASQLGLPVLIAVLAGLALAAAGSGQAGQAAATGALALGAQRQLNFTRANEAEADRIGYQLLTQAGFDPNGLANFFVRLQRQESSIGALPDFLRSHPLPRDRIADAELRLDRAGAERQRDSNAAAADGSPAYQLARERVRVLSSRNGVDLIRFYQNQLDGARGNPPEALRYGYALALQRAGRYREAATQIAALRQTETGSGELAYRILEAENALDQGDRQRAWRLFDAGLALYPGDFRLALHYGRALLDGGEPARARQLLEPFLKRGTGSLTLYETYAQAAQRTGGGVATHAALVEYYYLLGDLDMALEQARLGLKRGDGASYQRAQLQARLRQLEQEKARQEP